MMLYKRWRKQVPHSAWLVVVVLFGGWTIEADGLLDKPVSHFTFRGQSHKGTIAHLSAEGPGRIEEAVRNLAYHAEVSIAIEVLPPAAAEPAIPVEVEARQTTVGAILEQMVGQDRRYIYRERLGIIEVLPVGSDAGPANCLNMVIPKFIADADWNSVFQSLLCQIGRVSQRKILLPNPIRSRGCPGGSYSVLSKPPVGIIRMTFEQERVRDILHKLSANVGNMAWEASFKSQRTTCDEVSINSYQPRQWYPPDEPGQTWSEGLPVRCTTCHYHRN